MSTAPARLETGLGGVVGGNFFLAIPTEMYARAERAAAPSERTASVDHERNRAAYS